MPHLNAIYNYARWLTRSHQDADDVAQEAVLRAYEFFDTVRVEHMRAWMLTITRNACHSWFRRNGKEVLAATSDASLMEVASDVPDAQALLISSYDAESVRQAIEKLPLDYRDVLILREMEDLSYKQIAAMIQCPIGTVMSRLARARAKLESELRATKGEIEK